MSEMQEIELSFKDGVRRLMVGLSWEPNEQEDRYGGAPKLHDLDLSCALFDKGGSVLDVLTPQSPQREKYGQDIFHAGDHTSGGSDFEDEYIRINLDRLGEEVSALVFAVSTKGGLKFHEAVVPRCDFLEDSSLASFSSVDLKVIDFGNIAAVGLVRRTGAGWKLQQKVVIMPDLHPYCFQKALEEFK